MSAKLSVGTITGTTPAAAGSAAGATAISGLLDAETLTVIATLVGATGGVLDVYLQTSYDGGTTWVDFAHFPQLAAGAGSSVRVWHVVRKLQQTTLTTVGSGSSPAIAANTIVGGTWGDRIRAFYVAGASTSAGAAVNIQLVGWSPRGG